MRLFKSSPPKLNSVYSWILKIEAPEISRLRMMEENSAPSKPAPRLIVRQ